MKLLRGIWDGLNFETRIVGVAIVGVLLLLLIVFGRISACRDRSREQKIEDIRTNAARHEIEANVLTNQKVEVEKHAIETNANVNAVLGTDTNKRSGDFSTVRQRWCDDHPGDSLCR